MTWKVSVAAVPPVLQYWTVPSELAVAAPLTGLVVTVTDAGFGVSVTSVAPVKALIVVHWPAEALPVCGCRTGAAGGEMMVVVAIGWNWYGAWVQVEGVVVTMQPATTAAGYVGRARVTGTPRFTVALVSNSLIVDTMLPTPVAVTSKLHDGRVSVPPAVNTAPPVVASRYGVVVPGPRNVVPLGVVAVHKLATGAVHSVTVKGPVVVTLLASVNDQLPATMLPAKVELGGTGISVCRPPMEMTGTPLCEVGTSWLPPGTEIVMLLPCWTLAGWLMVSGS